MALFRKNRSYDEWINTERGKAFREKMEKIAEENARKKEEYEANTPPEKKEQVKLFKRIFTPVFICYAIALYWGFVSYKVIPVFICEIIISAVSFILFKKTPKKVRYPNCFMMPVIALLCTALFSIYLGFSFGFDRYIKFSPEETILVEESETSKDEVFFDFSNFELEEEEDN